MSERPFAVGGRLAVPSVYIAAEPGRVGQALPLLGDRVAQGGKLQAGVAPTFRSAPERHLRLCGPEVATVNSPLELTVGSSPKEKPTVARALNVACIYPLPRVGAILSISCVHDMITQVQPTVLREEAAGSYGNINSSPSIVNFSRMGTCAPLIA